MIVYFVTRFRCNLVIVISVIFPCRSTPTLNALKWEQNLQSMSVCLHRAYITTKNRINYKQRTCC